MSNMYISSLGSKISQNHLSILKWSLKKCWGWKVWTLSFQMPCRTHFFRVLDARIHHLEWKSFLLIFVSTSWEHVNIVFTLYWFRKYLDLLAKGQQKLSTFWDVIEEGLSYLQLFLELLDLIWGLRNVPVSKKSAQN